MVRKINKGDKTYGQCEECEMYYPTKELAQKCEDFCKKHSACDTSIIKHAVELKG